MMNSDILQHEIERCDDMLHTINGRCENDIFVPRTLCTLQSKEISEVVSILGNYRRLLVTMEEHHVTES